MGRGALRVAVVAMLLTASTVGSMRSSGAQIPVGGWSSPNIEWLGNVTLSGTTGAITGLLHDGYFYAEGLEAIEIFDVSDPVTPQRVSRIPLQPHPFLPSAVGVPDVVREGVDTNGELLVTSTTSIVGGFWTMFVFDVHDKESPRLIGRLEDAGSHPVCVLRCKWVYATSGEIIDLRDPANPRVAGRWNRAFDFTGSATSLRDVVGFTEVAPGRVLTWSTPMYLLDVSQPLKPRVLAKSDGSPNSRGRVLWPRMASNGIALSISQAYLMPRCELQDELGGSSVDSAFKTWDTSHWKTTGLITGMSEYRLRNGTYQDGDPAFSGASPLFWGCGTTDVNAHPKFNNGGFALVSGSSHGVKFLEIDKRGGIEEVGWFLPYANDTFSAFWITDEIVYTVDWPRGIDILRFDANA